MATTVFGPDHKHLVAVLVEARKASGLSQVELSKLVGKSQTHISNIERGERRVDVLEFIALARAMKMDALKLMSDVISRLRD